MHGSVLYTTKVLAYKAVDEHKRLQIDKLAEETIQALKSNNFRPEKFTDPKGLRRFTVAPVHSFKCRHIQLDKYTLPPILARAGIECPYYASDDDFLDVLWKCFDFAKIGFATKESLRTDVLEFR
jgi:hypothetical protein